MDLLSILTQTSRSLSAQQGVAATAAHNIQNANTPGYARQRADLVTVTPAATYNGSFIGRGVQLGSVYQIRDRFIESQMPRAQGAAARSSAESAALSAVHALDPDSSSGLGAALANFYSAARSVAGNAADSVLRQGMVDAARSLASAFNRTSVALRDARIAADDKVSALATEATAAAEAIARLNVEIQNARASGGEPNDLIDQRYRAMDTLSRLTGAVPVLDAAGMVNMTLDGGTALVSGDRSARFVPVPDASNNGHYQVQIVRADGNGPFPLPASSIGGEMGGTLAARDGALRDAEQRIDQLAWDFGNALNAVHRSGYALDGSTGHDLFSLGAGVAGAAAAIAVDPTLDADPTLLAGSSDPAGLPGNADVFHAIVATEKEALPSGADPIRTLASITGDFGSRTSRATAVAANDAAILANLETMRESVSGVNLDEELIELSKAQRAYEAISKVLQTTDEMLETLMRLR